MFMQVSAIHIRKNLSLLSSNQRHLFSSTDHSSHALPKDSRLLNGPRNLRFYRPSVWYNRWFGRFWIG